MGITGTAVAWGSRASVRRHLAAGGAFASASILAVSLLTVPPNSSGAKTEFPAVQLAAFARPLTPLRGALLGNEDQPIAALTQVVSGGIAYNTSAGVTAPIAFKSVSVSGINGQQVNDAPLAQTNTAVAASIDPLAATIEAITATIGPTVGFFAIALFVGTLVGGAALLYLALPVLWPVSVVLNIFYGLTGGLGLSPPAVAAPFAPTAASTTMAPTLASDPPLSDPPPVTIATPRKVDAAPATKSGKADVSTPVTSNVSPPNRAGDVDGIRDRNRAAVDGYDFEEKTDEAPTEMPRARAPEPPANSSTSESPKPAARLTTPPPVVRDSLGAPDEKPPRNGDHLINRSVARDEGVTTGRPSSAGSPAGLRLRAATPRRGNSSHGNADGFK
jgi:hypothetical protein